MLGARRYILWIRFFSLHGGGGGGGGGEGVIVIKTGKKSLTRCIHSTNSCQMITNFLTNVLLIVAIISRSPLIH